YNAKTYRYRLTLFGVLHFLLVTLIYAISFNQHFETSPVLEFLDVVSPFLRRLTQLQLLFGLKIFLYNIYEMRMVNRVTNGVAEMLSSIKLKTTLTYWKEFISYSLLFSTFLLSIGFGLYIAYEMEFILPPLDHILVGVALFIPHFMLAGAVRYFTVGQWLFREILHTVEINFNEVTTFDINIKKSGSLETFVNNNTKSDRDFTLRKQLLMLVVLNSNCLLAGVYSIIYFKTYWYIMFGERAERAFYAAIYGIFVFIVCDYICILFSEISFNNVLQFLITLVISIIVIYQYLNDKIKLLDDRIDGSNSVEEE
ncbi:uncharacterized protein LOC119674638, partial [Teleopsis dalmanni]|uniref:uncharacterized protein LOC119674638 n=1 Tax=Teleopsis dalmanni TaxID=139649 RepID=UPI0018CEB497